MIKGFKLPLLSFLTLGIVGLAIQFGLNEYVQIIVLFMLVNTILAMSLNLVNGFTGQFSLGHAGFMAIGAYASAWASLNLGVPEGLLGLPIFVLYGILGGLVAAAAGWLVGLPSLKLRGDYLAIVTLGFGEIIRVALLNMDFLGGARGLHQLPTFPDLQIYGSANNFLPSFAISLFWSLTCFFFIWRLTRGSYGRAFLSVREDEIAAEAMGINTTVVKVRAFVLSSFFAGVAGALFAHITAYISPASFTFMRSVDAVIMVVLGGMGSITGSIAAAAFLTIVPELLRPLQDLTGVDLRMVIYSLCLILVMILRPRGLFGELEMPDVWRRYVHKNS
ncbi:MAG: branched-chain amino acid ABC transporter permease [Bdellovibrionaceae bacterium]|nr:branched-chain amino acid ABC transporter permease [Pseudobdellovibrionaceae bacterium]